VGNRGEEGAGQGRAVNDTDNLIKICSLPKNLLGVDRQRKGRGRSTQRIFGSDAQSTRDFLPGGESSDVAEKEKKNSENSLLLQSSRVKEIKVDAGDSIGGTNNRLLCSRDLKSVEACPRTKTGTAKKRSTIGSQAQPSPKKSEFYGGSVRN